MIDARVASLIVQTAIVGKRSYLALSLAPLPRDRCLRP